MKRVARPGVSIPLTISVALLATLLSVGLTLVIAMVGALVLHREVGALMGRPKHPPLQEDEPASAPVGETVAGAG